MSRWAVTALALVTTLLLVGSACSGCSVGDDATPSATSPSATSPSATMPSSTRVPTLTPLPAAPTLAATGQVLADLRQSSRDAAAGRIEVWLDNDTLAQLEPIGIRYVDPRLRAPLRGTRLRSIPSRSERGFPLYLPTRPLCGERGSAGRGRVELTLADATSGSSTRVVDVEDPVDLVDRFTIMRCRELAVARVATLAWAPSVADGDVRAGDEATLTLVVRPTGIAGQTVVIESVTGTPVLSAVGAPYWTVDRTIRGDDPVTRIGLPLQPTRCDPHAFLESGGATAFGLRLSLDGAPVDLVLRMSTAGAAAAIDFAQRSCGF